MVRTASKTASRSLWVADPFTFSGADKSHLVATRPQDGRLSPTCSPLPPDSVRRGLPQGAQTNPDEVLQVNQLGDLGGDVCQWLLGSA